ncbi:MAG: fibronectin type III domain-containing protein, partial [Treponema sp.]|nr:fibronectin type III domain-containing protein [Treponema sp.]
MKKFTLLLSFFAVFLLAGCENPIYQWLLPEKKDAPSGPLDINAGWNSADGQGVYLRSLQAWGGDEEATLSWGSPSSNSAQFAGVKIDFSNSYTDIQSKSARASGTEFADKSVKEIVIKELENGKPYYFAVTPLDADDKPLGHAMIISATPHGNDPERPDDIQNLIGGRSSGSISLNWSLPDTHPNGGEAKKVVSVEVSVVPREGAIEVADHLLGAVVSSLVNSKPYTFYIRTVNAAGKKSYGVSTVMIPSAAGSDSSATSDDDRAVTNLVAQAGSETVTLNWKDPNTQCTILRIYYAYGAPNTAYADLVQKVKDAAEGAGQSPRNTGQTQFFTPIDVALGDGIKGIVINKEKGIKNVPDNGAEKEYTYFFAVTPVNDQSVLNIPGITSATPRDPSGRAADVTGLTGTALDSRVTLFWDSLKGTGITVSEDDITVVPDAPDKKITVYDDGGASITGLVNGTSYIFTVITSQEGLKPSMGKSLVLTPQEGADGGFNLILKAEPTNIRVSGKYIVNAQDNPEIIPVVVYFIDGTWYDGLIVKDGEETGYIAINYPKTQPPGIGRMFASLILANGKMVALGRAWKKDEPIDLKISFTGELEFRPAVNGYIPIAAAGELALINRDENSLKGTYKQECHLNLVGMQQGMQQGLETYRLNWEPLGREDAPFTGTYDGNGKKIYALYISRISPNAGLFGYIDHAALENITVNSGIVLGRGFVSALCGYNWYGTIKNCTVGNKVNVEGDSSTGGLAGYNMGTIEASSNAGRVYSPSDTIGGIAGENILRITDCTNTGAVSGNESVGGIAGSSNGTSSIIEKSNNTGAVRANGNGGGVAGKNDKGMITGCHNSGPVKGTGESHNIGGVCGQNMDGEITASSNKSTGTVSGKYNVGGVAGENAYERRDWSVKPYIIACKNEGAVTGTGTGTGNDGYTGGVCGNNQGFITASYNTGAVSGNGATGGVAGLNSAIHYEADP